ncbi:MAG: sialidase family protein, partial [Syntrophothermus sp.]
MFKKQQFVLLMSLLLVTLFISNVFAQKRDPRKWNTDVRLSQVFFDDSKIEMIPSTHLNYVHPNTLTSIYDLKNVKAFVYPNFRVHPSNNSQSEVPITRHPTNGNIMFGSSNAVKFSPSLFISEGMYLTTDGGVTWFGSDTTNAAPINNHGGDPAPAIGPEGNLYNSNLGYSTDGIFATVSTNMGATWSSEFTIISGSQDKNHTFVNDIPSSPYYGRVYVTWSRFTATNPPISIAYSTNGGQTYNAWQDVHTVASGHYAQGVNGSVGPNGEVYLAWQSPIAGSPYTGDFVGFAKSTDGGATYTYNNIAYQTNGIRGTLSNKGGIRVNDFPWMGVDKTNGPKRGNIYIVTAEKNLAPAGSDPDIVFHRSTDGGTTWSAGIRVNQDALNNGKDQYMPACVVDDKGAVYVVYYDSRNTSSDSAEVYVSRSMDGGDTWEDVKVSDHRFKPYPISGLAGGYQGDYIGITHSNGSVFPYWADNSTGIYQAWSTKVSFGPVITHNSLPNTENLAGPYPVNASINSASPLSSVKIFWKRGSGSLDSTAMTLDGTTWTGNIPGNGTAATYQYYIYAKDENGNFGSAPGVPGTFYSFDAMPDNVAPVITHTTLPNQYRETWPPVLSALATDNIGIDSIWVTYKLNTNGVERNFALNVNSDGYSNTFNCD